MLSVRLGLTMEHGIFGIQERLNKFSEHWITKAGKNCRKDFVVYIPNRIRQAFKLTFHVIWTTPT